MAHCFGKFYMDGRSRIQNTHNKSFGTSLRWFCKIYRLVVLYVNNTMKITYEPIRRPWNPKNTFPDGWWTFITTSTVVWDDQKCHGMCAKQWGKASCFQGNACTDCVYACMWCSSELTLGLLLCLGKKPNNDLHTSQATYDAYTLFTRPSLVSCWMVGRCCLFRATNCHKSPHQ